MIATTATITNEKLGGTVRGGASPCGLSGFTAAAAAAVVVAAEIGRITTKGAGGGR